MIGLLIGVVATVFSYTYFLRNKNTIISPVNSDSTADTFQQPKVVHVDTVIPIVNTLQPTFDFVNRDSLVSFAKTLIGTPYLYGSTDPAKGFDCSGFITYVFNHYKISVPRSSYDFEKIGKKTALTACNIGDLILFTGTNPQEKTIGHIGIVTNINGGIPLFIHSSSGKVNSVTITSMESTYYQNRFVSVVDVLTK